MQAPNILARNAALQNDPPRDLVKPQLQRPPKEKHSGAISTDQNDNASAQPHFKTLGQLAESNVPAAWPEKTPRLPVKNSDDPLQEAEQLSMLENAL